jgi:hypothetical protein
MLTYVFVRLFGNRLKYAVMTLWILVLDPVTRRRFPWAYLFRRLIRDPWMASQGMCIAVALVGFPLTYALPLDMQQPAKFVVLAVWVTGHFVAPLRVHARSR